MTKSPQPGQGEKGSSPQKSSSWSRCVSWGSGVKDGRWNLPVLESRLSPKTQDTLLNGPHIPHTGPGQAGPSPTHPAQRRDARHIQKRESSDGIVDCGFSTVLSREGALPPSLCGSFGGATSEGQRCRQEGGYRSPPPRRFLMCVITDVQGVGAGRNRQFLYPLYTRDQGSKMR